MNRIFLQIILFQLNSLILFSQHTDSFPSLNFYENALQRVTNSKGKKINFFSEKTIYGKSISNRNFLGKITFVNFTFEACQPCVFAESLINMLSLKYKAKQKFQILNFTFDKPEKIKKIIKQRNLKYKNFISISKEKCYKLNFRSGFPTFFIINSDGIIEYAKAGGELTLEETNKYFYNEFIPIIDKLINESNKMD